MTKTMNIKKLTRVENEDKSRPEILAFQVVEFEINYFGSIIKDTLDTKIMKDGSQIIIDGNGFLKHGIDINTLN